MLDIDERQAAIAQLVRAKKTVKALALSKRFDVSVETIRKDLLDLQDQGVLVRVHGGAKLRSGGTESAYDRRRSVNTSAKESIALAAAEGIEDGSTIYLDYGTTTFALAAALVRTDRKLRVLTNALPIVNELATSDSIETLVLGGILRPNERSLSGPLAERALDSVYMDTGFFGCAGIDAAAGITNIHALECAASQKAMSHCSSVVLLADSDKWGTIASNKLADFEQIDVLISESQPVGALATALDTAGVSIITPEDHQ